MMFYFHIRKGGHVTPDGLELPHLNAARDEAIKSAREIVSNAGMSAFVPLAIFEVQH